MLNKWIVMNDLQTNKPSFQELQTTITTAMQFVRDANSKENIPKSHFYFYVQTILEAKGIDMINLEYLVNHNNKLNWTVRAGSSTLWRGPRRKTENLFVAYLDLLT